LNFTTVWEKDDIIPQSLPLTSRARANGAPPPHICEGTSLPRLSYIRLSQLTVLYVTVLYSFHIVTVVISNLSKVTVMRSAADLAGAGERCPPSPHHPGANLKSISHRCHPILVAFAWELTKETINLPLSCLYRDQQPEQNDYHALCR